MEISKKDEMSDEFSIRFKSFEEEYKAYNRCKFSQHENLRFLIPQNLEELIGDDVPVVEKNFQKSKNFESNVFGI